MLDTGLLPRGTGGLPAGGDPPVWHCKPSGGRMMAASAEEAAKKPFQFGKGLDGSGPGVQECKVGSDEDGVAGADPGGVALGADHPRSGSKTAGGEEAVIGSGEGRDGARGVDSDDGGDGAPIGGPEDPSTGSCGTLGSVRKLRTAALGIYSDYRKTFDALDAIGDRYDLKFIKLKEILKGSISS